MKRFPGSFISSNAISPSYGINTAAPGFWNLQQHRSYKLDNSWPNAQVKTFLWTWGYNGAGALGLGNTTHYSSPKQVGSGYTWKKTVMPKLSDSIWSIKNDGTLWSWGQNNVKQLGLNNTINYSSPKQIGSTQLWRNVFSAGSNSLYGLPQNGMLYRAGTDLITDTTAAQLRAPSSYQSIFSDNWFNISGGMTHVVGLRNDGTLWAWGAGSGGKLGLGNSTNYSFPKQIGAGTNWVYTAASSYSSFAIKNDGTLWSWGGNSYGQLGLGNIISYSSPKQVGAGTNWAKVFAGRRSVAAVKTDGTLWVWGGNTYGQLGLGNTTNYSSPKQVGVLTNWSKISIGRKHVLAIKTDGTLWAWGDGGGGKLGLGNTTSYSSPKQVGIATNWMDVTAGYRISSALRGI